MMIDTGGKTAKQAQGVTAKVIGSINMLQRII